MSVRTLILAIYILINPLTLYAQETLEESEPGISEVLFEHILDSHEISLLPGTPAITLPFGMTVHLLMMIASIALISVIFLISGRRSNVKPKGLTTILEFAVLFVRNDIVYPVMGEKRGEKWLSFFFTFFIFIFFMNFLGLVPAFKASTGNFTVTSALAIIIFLLIFIIGIKNLGLFGYFKNLYPHGSPAPIGVFVAILELVSTIIKSAVLSLRLFANMFAGHLAILTFIVLMFMLIPKPGIGPVVSVISVAFGLFTYALEVLVALIQAFVFTLLSCIFITTASSSHEH